MHLCAPLFLTPCAASVCPPCICADEFSAPQCASSRRDSDGQQICELCPIRLTKAKGKLHRSGAGKICHCCYTKASRSHAAASVSKPAPRTKRPYATLGPTQQWKRRKQALADITNTLQQTGCPLETLKLHPRPSPAELLHLSTADRERIRSVPSLHIPPERGGMIKCKQLLATSHATETGTFAGGAFMTDPVRFVSVLCALSSFIAVGGDAGGGRCVLGVTYGVKEPRSEKQAQHFAPLLVYEGGDSWLELQDCRAEGLTPFTGDSAAFPHIWAVLQHLIDH